MGSEVVRKSRPRLFPTLIGVVLLILGLALLAGGISLMRMGGSLYYVIAGAGFALSGILLIFGRRAGVGVYALFLFATTVWAFWEIRLDWWQLVPRLALWFVIGVVLLLPAARRPLLPLKKPLHTVGLFFAVLLAGATAVGSQYFQYDEIQGEQTRTEAGVPRVPARQPEGDWQSYGRTPFGDRYSPLAQITPQNAHLLKPAWRFRTGDLPGPKDPKEITAENTPLKANGMLYLCTPHSKVIALDPDTGTEIWRFDPELSTQNALDFKGWAHMTCRGVAYHNVGAYPIDKALKGVVNECPKRIFVPTADTRLIALNADTGKPCENFGDEGSIFLGANIGDFTAGGYFSTSPPGVTRNLVIIGAHVTDNESTDEPSGVVRAFDVRTGKLVWNWDSGDPTNTEPILPGLEYTRNSPNMWSVMSVDEKLGMLYLPMGNQTPDQWGAARKQPELYSAGVTALDIATGKVRWTYQFTHHDLWDMDVGGQPTLMDLNTATGIKPALLASTKQGSIYVLDRSNGTPIVPIKENPAPQGAMEGEFTAPTQPLSALNMTPAKLKESDMWGVTPIDQMLCRITYRSLRYDGIYTPPSTKGTLVYPGNMGVFNWGGISVDPMRQIAFLSPNYMAFVSTLVPATAVGAGPIRVSETNGVQPNKGAPYGVILKPLLSQLGLPCQAPPWGYVAGVDLTTNKVIWKHKNGSIRDNTSIPLPFNMGVPSMGGPISTAGGVAFLAGTLDQYLRAYDISNGKQLWAGRLPAGGQATPMTYTGKDGRQYVLIVAGGHGSLGTRQSDFVMAFALPKSP
ncbi:glucose/quinate/shikimate family membrane-bound PQQ-dependent dehydrogenase [Pseudomonas sp. NA-150]|uniref:glucose/quinate/shikimate family membrane-bound PQQ-dependent dehydrogenase n=1 Tax=Pseudomonas sp. NA-150 TaxID=3367525 RepID=UPI0037C66F65